MENQTRFWVERLPIENETLGSLYEVRDAASYDEPVAYFLSRLDAELFANYMDEFHAGLEELAEYVKPAKV